MIEKINETKMKFLRFFTPEEIVRISKCMIMQICTFAYLPMSAYAGIDDMFGNLVGIVCKIFFYIGSILLVWAIGQLILAFKNEDADSKSRAIQVLVVAILAMSIAPIYTAVTASMNNRISVNESITI